ncbi:MAG: prepilin-type N-terminal cleavage/methylation domain-containing protein [Patescibacteria group bacterium]
MRKGFTLLELLITVAIISIVVAVVYVVINPVETLSQARDGRRISEVSSIDEAITLALQQNPAIFEGDSYTIYLSLPDTSPTCDGYVSVLPLISVGPIWHYACVTRENLFKANGYGWIPMNFSNLAIRPLTSLPIDPVNNAAKGFYYAYVPGWEIDAKLESKKYSFRGADDRVSLDGGDSTSTFEKGQNLLVSPIITR